MLLFQSYRVKSLNKVLDYSIFLLSNRFLLLFNFILIINERSRPYNWAEFPSWEFYSRKCNLFLINKFVSFLFKYNKKMSCQLPSIILNYVSKNNKKLKMETSGRILDNCKNFNISPTSLSNATLTNPNRFHKSEE